MANGFGGLLDVLEGVANPQEFQKRQQQRAQQAQVGLLREALIGPQGQGGLLAQIQDPAERAVLGIQAQQRPFSAIGSIQSAIGRQEASGRRAKQTQIKQLKSQIKGIQDVPAAKRGLELQQKLSASPKSIDEISRLSTKKLASEFGLNTNDALVLKRNLREASRVGFFESAKPKEQVLADFVNRFATSEDIARQQQIDLQRADLQSQLQSLEGGQQRAPQARQLSLEEEFPDRAAQIKQAKEQGFSDKEIRDFLRR